MPVSFENNNDDLFPVVILDLCESNAAFLNRGFHLNHKTEKNDLSSCFLKLRPS